jgi:hypothetical protein
MSRPAWFQGTYERYKADTNTCTTWLVETAKEAGFASQKLIAGELPAEGKTALTVLQLETQAAHVVEQIREATQTACPTICTINAQERPQSPIKSGQAVQNSVCYT